MPLLSAIPALPVRDIAKATTFYRDRLGFAVLLAEDGFAIVQRDAVEIHLWQANAPGPPGAETQYAGATGCKIRVQGIQALYAEFQQQEIIHPSGSLAVQWWGIEDFTVFDNDGNAIAFYEVTAC